MNWSFQLKAPGNLTLKLLVALSEEKIVTDVHDIGRTKHLNHVHLYAKSDRFLSNLLDYGTTESLSEGSCPGDDIRRASGHMAVEFSPEQASQGEICFECCASLGSNLDLHDSYQERKIESENVCVFERMENLS